MGPPLAHFYGGLPDVRSLSPREIAAYLQWRYDALTARPDDGEGDEDYDAEGW
ncbi:MAG TPA: hypothetical protein VFR67_05950 [Pilimelia sp.]|nr:hypothetical protein [Pilimelia sp.]